MRFLLDTCVLIELQRPRGNQQVHDFVSQLHKRQVYVSVISVGELTRGISMIEDDLERRKRLIARFDEFRERFADQILPFDIDVSQLWGELTAAAALRGHTVPATDGQIAATARMHGLYVMTRNVRHFQESGVEIVNPWEL